MQRIPARPLKRADHAGEAKSTFGDSVCNLVRYANYPRNSLQINVICIILMSELMRVL